MPRSDSSISTIVKSAATAFLLAALALVTTQTCWSQDVLYPADAGVKNVKTDYGAVGDGQADDSDAIIAAIQDNVGQFGFGILYFPTGRYLVTKQLSYLLANGWWGAFLTLQGQNQANTIIVLQDNCPGFQEPTAPAAVIFTASNAGNDDASSPNYNPDGSGNQGFRNHIMNLTVDTGHGNPGAIGIDYMANNNTRLSDVTIQSEDGAGVIGLNLQRGDPGPMYIKNLTITGFSTAESISNSYGVWMENVTLSGQTTSGIDATNGSLSIRGFTSTNSVPALRIPGWGGVVSIVDATMTGGSPSISAVQIGEYSLGTLFIRNASTAGYQSVVSNNGLVIPGTTLQEWSSITPESLFAPVPPQSLNMAVQNTPAYNDTNFNNWANVVTYGASPNNPVVELSTFDSYPAIQAAIDSGHTTVYFPPGNYMISQPIHVRGSVIRLLFLSAWLLPLNTNMANEPAIQVDSGTSGSVVIDGLGVTANYWVNSSSGYVAAGFGSIDFVDNYAGTLVMMNNDYINYSNTTNASNQTVFMESVYGGDALFTNQTVFARNLDPETWSPTPHVSVMGGELWVLGLKIEGTNSSVLTVANNGSAEVLGLAAGVFSDVPGSIPMVINDGSTVSISASRSNPYIENPGVSDFDAEIQESLNGSTEILCRAASGRFPSAFPYGYGSTFALFMDSPTLALTPSISSVTTTPSSPVSGSPFTFNVIGTNFDPTNSTVVLAGPGCSTPCSGITPGTSTQVSASITLPAGSYSITLKNGTTGLTSASVPAFTVGNPPPAVASVTTSPASPVSGSSFTFNVIGTNFDPTKTTVVLAGPGCSTPCSVNTPGTSTQVSGSITLSAGSYSITLKNGTTGLTSASVPAFTVGNPPPAVASVTTSPASPVSGSSFTFNVIGTNFDPTKTTVVLAGPGCSTPCSVNTPGTSTQVSGSITLPAGSYSITLKNGTTGLTSASVPAFTVGNPPPAVASVTTSPASPVSGSSFTFNVIGTNFDPTNSTVVLTGPGCSTPCSVNTPGTSTQVSGSISLSAGSYSITLKNGTTGLTSASVPAFTVGNPPPAVASVTTSPASPVSGSSFTFNVIGTNFDPTNSTVVLAGPGCSTPCSVNTPGTSTQVSGSITLSAGSYSITLKNGTTGLTSASVPAFTVGNPPPAVASVTTSPASPVSGSSFTFNVIGTNFDPTKTTVVLTGPGCSTPCSVNTPGTSTQVSGSITLSAGSYSITLKNGTTGLTSASVPAFTVGNPPPAVASVTTSPASPVSGSSFTFNVIGTNFDPTNSTVVLAGPGCSTPCSVNTPGTSTQVSGSISLSAGSYSITLKNGTTGLTSASVPAFTVGNPPPAVASVTTSPASPVSGSSFTFNVIGTNFDPTNSTVVLTGPGCSTPCSVNTPGTSTQVSGSISLSAGSYSITLKNGTTGLTSASVPAFTVGNPPPAVASVTTSPASPVSGSSFTFNVIGTNFDPTKTTVVLAGPGCSTPCSVNTPGTSTQVSGSITLSAGSYSITLKNGTTGLTSASVPAFTVGNPPPAVASVTTSPASPVSGSSFTFNVIGTNFDPTKTTVVLAGPGCSTPCSVNTPGTSTQVSGSISLSAGSYSITLKNGTTGLTSASVPAFTVGNPPPAVASVTTSPASPVSGSSFTFNVIGTNFDPTKTTVVLAGPGCSTPCSVNTPGTSTQVSGSITLPAGSYSITLKNGTTGLTSASVPAFTVGNPPPAVASVTTSPASPVSGSSFTFNVIGTNFDPTNSTVVLTGPGCSTPCSVNTPGTSTQVSGSITLSAGSYSITLKNGTTGLTSASWGSLTIASPGVFADVAPTDYYFEAASLLYASKITAGCSATPLMYCPDQQVTRAELAVFSVRAAIGGDPLPGTYSTTPYFTDVPQNAFGFAWIQKVYELGFTSGCGGNNYCPDSPVTRDDMASFMVRLRYGSTTAFTYPSTPYFTDVAPNQFGFAWIQRLREDSIVAGCGATTYCPLDVVTRGQMAIFIMRAGFNQLLPVAAPQITSLSQTTIMNGSTATITVIGLNTHFVQGQTIVNAVTGLAAGPATVLSPNSLSVTVTAQSGFSQPAPLWVTTGSEDAVLPNGISIQ